MASNYHENLDAHIQAWKETLKSNSASGKNYDHQESLRDIEVRVRLLETPHNPPSVEDFDKLFQQVQVIRRNLQHWIAAVGDSVRSNELAKKEAIESGEMLEWQLGGCNE